MAALSVPLLALLALVTDRADPDPVGLEFAEPAATAKPSSQPEAESGAEADRSQEEIETFADIDAFNAAVEATMVKDDESSEAAAEPSSSAAPQAPPSESPGSGTTPEPGLTAAKPTFDSLYPRLWLGVGAGASFRGDINIIGYGLSGAYYFLPELGGGLRFDHHMQFADRGVTLVGPRNIISVLAEAHWLALPRRRFTPRTTLGLGPVFFSEGYRALGRWTASVDMLAKVGPVYLSVGVAVGAMFPLRKYEEQFVSCGLSRRNCSFTLQPRFGVGFGSGR